MNKYKKYIPTLIEVRNLAVERREEYYREREGNTEAIDLTKIDLEAIIESRDKSKLLQYLKLLDYDSIKVVQAVMYIGGYNTGSKIEDADSRIDWMINSYLDWHEDKFVEVEQIYEKMPLCDYMDTAFERLGI